MVMLQVLDDGLMVLYMVKNGLLGSLMINLWLIMLVDG